MLNRRFAMGLIAAGALDLFVRPRPALGTGRDVPWLAEVQQAPKVVPRDAAGRLDPLLAAADGTPVRTPADWETARAALRRRWMDFLGPMPEKRPEISLEVLSEERAAGCLRQLVRYEGEPGLPVEGYLLRPAEPATTRHAGIVGLHQTTPHSIDEIAGVIGRDEMQIGLKLCRRGFVVFCPRCFLWQGVSSYQEAVEGFQRRRPGTLGMHKMLYDAMRGVDVLASLPEVDPDRIGAAGHSLGAKAALYLAAFDDRVRAAVASEGGIGLRFTNWDAPWYLGPAIRDEDFRLNHHQLLALIAPRAFLILAGEEGRGAADGDRTWPLVEAALPVWKVYGAPPRLGLYNHRQGHSLPEEAYRRMAEWLETYLNRQES